MTIGSRLVVFSGQLTYSVRKGIAEIDAALPDAQWLILVHSPARDAARLVRNQWRNVRRNGWRWIPYQARDLCQRLRSRVRGASNGPRAPGAAFTLDALRARPNVRVVEVNDINAAEAVNLVSEFIPDIGLSLAAPILRRPVFSAPRLGTINLHKGRLPDYRGMPPAFWELWNDESSVGCSVHWVDDALDAGAVLRSSTVARQLFSTVRGLQLQLDEVGVTLMRDTVVDILGRRAVATPQPAGGRTFRKPTLRQVAQLDCRLAMTLPKAGSATARLVRELRSIVAVIAWRTILWRLLPPRITVVLYHRVSDEVRDNLTVGVEQFERQMTLVNKYFRPIDLTTLLSSRSIPRSRTPMVAISFDDGYHDNYANAVPSLLRHRIPAAFFVSTGIVNSELAFPHDDRRGNAPIGKMSWNQLREMRALGFDIGSHSVNHIDCAAESEAVVRDELQRSKADLERELGLSSVVFAYPYGGRQHMTPQRLDLVRQAGYAGCLAAYGGTNLRRVDPFNVMRGGMHWGFSDYAFLRECLGW